MSATAVSRSRKTTAPAGRGTEATLRRWLIRRCEQHYRETGQPVDRVRGIRTSSETVTLWQASARTSFAAADRTDPDVAEALALGFDVVRWDAIGESRREDLGDAVFVVRMCHAPGGEGRRQLGVILHVGRTFFLYLLSSARAGNLRAETADRAGNAATEVLSTVVRAMWQAGRLVDSAYRPHVFARDHDRIVRDESHGAALKRTFVNCHVIAHTPQTFDLRQPSQAQHFSFGSMLAAGAAEAAIRGMNRAEIVIQAEGGYYESLAAVPFTHGPRVITEQDARTGVTVVTEDRHALAVVGDVDAARKMLRRLVDEILHGQRTDWVAVGDLMAEMGLPSRLPKHLRHKILLRDLPPATRARAAQSVFSERWVGGWRDGAFEKLVHVKIDVGLDLSDLQIEEAFTGDRRPAYRCRISMPVPEGGWGVADDEWDDVLARRYPGRGRPRRLSGMVLPLAGLPEWDCEVEGCQFDVSTKSGRYGLRSRPLGETVHADGSHRGWDDCTVTRRAVLRAVEWHADVARAMREALVAVDAQLLPVHLVTAQTSRTEETAIAVAARRVELEGAVEDAECQLDGAEDERNRLAGRARRADASEEDRACLARAAAAVERAEQRLASARAELDALAAAPTEASAPVVSADTVSVTTATAEFVATALEKCPGAAPAWLAEACRQLLTDVRVWPVHVPGERRAVGWSAELTLVAVTADGREEVVTRPLSGQVLDRTNPTGGAATSHGPEVWSWSFFYQGRSWAEIGDGCGVDGSGKKNSYLYKGCEEWLRPAVPDRALRTAALDCPVPATRRVLWHAVTGDRAALLGIDRGYVDHVVATYGSPALRAKWGWCRDTHYLARRVADLLLAAGGSAPLDRLAEQLGVAPAVITALAAENGKSTKGGRAAKPAALAVSPFTKSWRRSDRWLTADQKLISLRPCPHADCPERLRGGTPFASHVLAVPETEAGHGVLCPSCRRLPLVRLGDVRFPEDYLRPWSSRFGQGSRGGARAQSGTHLDPSRPDPGAAEALPDTGAVARPETRVNRSGNYVPKEMQETAMKGGRVLPVGLSDDELVALTEAAERCGGRVGARVKPSLLCVVVPSRRFAEGSARARRAAAAGVEVLTLAEFLCRGDAGWPTGSGGEAA